MILLVLANCSSPGGTISGLVVDQHGTVAGAVVRVQATDHSTITDSQGCFTLVGLPLDEPVTLTAWASGYFIVAGEETFRPGISDVVLTLVSHDNVDNPDYEWVSAFASAEDPGNCQNCHSVLGDPDSALPFDEWARDAHASSAGNERFLTMYTGTDISGNQSPITRKFYSRDYGSLPLPPDSSKPYFGPGFKLDFPESDGNCAACHAPAAAIDAPYSTDPTSVSGVGAEGVACDFCHKIWDVKLDESGLPHPNMPGVLSYEFRRPSEGHQLFAGPFNDVAPGEDTYSPLQNQSQFCAPCHFGIFWDNLIYNSYGEWLDSPYSDPQSGQTCQDCHMPVGFTDHFARLDEGGLVRAPESIFSHLMPGASDEEFLREAVSMTVEAWREHGEAHVQVEILNDNTGHHIPTDSPLRHMILLVQVTDAQGNDLVQISGPTIPAWGGIGDPSQGYFAGLPGTAYAKVLQEVWTGISPTGAYWNPTRVISDTRIAAMAKDSTIYSFTAPEMGEINFSVRLIFRRAFIDLMDLKGWNTPDILMDERDIVLPPAD
jgi:nitrate/TMAO reductase-like tetraheme cytochrome c subunit